MYVYTKHALLNTGVISLIVSNGDRDKDSRELCIVLTYLQKKGVISDGEGGGGVLGCVCDDTTEGDVQMGRGPIQALTHSSQPASATSAEAYAYYSIHLKKHLLAGANGDAAGSGWRCLLSTCLMKLDAHLL